MKMSKYCDSCEKYMLLTEDGYCTGCGKHADNMIPPTPINVTMDELGEALNKYYKEKGNFI